MQPNPNSINIVQLVICATGCMKGQCSCCAHVALMFGARFHRQMKTFRSVIDDVVGTYIEYSRVQGRLASTAITITRNVVHFAHGAISASSNGPVLEH